MTDSKQRATFGHKVILEKSEDNLIIGMKDLYSLTASEYIQYQEEIAKNLQDIKNKEEQEYKQYQEEETLILQKEKEEQDKKEYNLKYSKTNFLTACNYVLLGSMYGWYKIDKASIHSIIDEVLNGSLKVEEALKENEDIKNIFYSLIMKGE